MENTLATFGRDAVMSVRQFEADRAIFDHYGVASLSHILLQCAGERAGFHSSILALRRTRRAAETRSHGEKRTKMGYLNRGNADRSRQFEGLCPKSWGRVLKLSADGREQTSV